MEVPRNVAQMLQNFENAYIVQKILFIRRPTARLGPVAKDY